MYSHKSSSTGVQTVSDWSLVNKQFGEGAVHVLFVTENIYEADIDITLNYVLLK